jgi:hypothetical protein
MAAKKITQLIDLPFASWADIVNCDEQSFGRVGDALEVGVDEVHRPCARISGTLTQTLASFPRTRLPLALLSQ